MRGVEEIELSDEIWTLLILSQGAHTRKKILRMLLLSPKNCNQIAGELRSDWWTVQRHLKLLMKAKVIKNMNFGRIRFYKTTPKGELALKCVSSKSQKSKLEL